MKEKIVQITSGKGPPECERVVAKLVRKILKLAEREQLIVEIIELVPGKPDEAFLSALLRVKGEKAEKFCREWTGTIQWIAQSPFRKFHKRKNWFAGVVIYDISSFPEWKERDVSFQSMRSSGPGGQHVNKTESAVRATHIPTGISVTASDERSQILNKKLATERLKNKLLGMQIDEQNKQQQDQWQEHNSLERGNAVKIFRESLE